MPYTPPSAGTSDWDVPLNQALADINADVVTAQDTADTAVGLGVAATGDIGDINDDLSDIFQGNGAQVTTQQDTTSTSYTDLATVGPSVSITLQSARRVLVFVKAELLQISTTDDVFMSYATTGAVVNAASDADAVRHNGSGTAEAYSSFGFVDCPAGTTSFTAKYRVQGGTGRYVNRSIAVVVV